VAAGERVKAAAGFLFLSLAWKDYYRMSLAESDMHKRSVLVTLWICLAATCAHAGPPFFTDDPDPVPFRHYEFYTFSTLDRAFDSYGAAVPAFEFNPGAAPNLQLHVVVPMALLIPNQGPTTSGVGDVELGAKYRLIQEKGARPQIGIFPMLELPTGNNQRGLGNGQLWAKLPIWVQKNWGPWTSYGGGGYIINHAQGMRDHAFFGWQVQREICKKFTLGAEWFRPGRESVTTGNSHIVNVGGIYNFTQNFSLLFSAGHSVHGDSHMVAYVGLYWTWGTKEDRGESKLTKAMFSGTRRGLRF